jgi:hypothetical protein
VQFRSSGDPGCIFPIQRAWMNNCSAIPSQHPPPE